MEPPSWSYVAHLRQRVENGEVDGNWNVERSELLLPVDLPVDGHPGWSVAATFLVTEADLALISLSVSKDGGDSTHRQVLTVQVLRAIRLESLYREARSLVLNPTPEGPRFVVRDDFLQHRRPGRRGRPDEDYADIARRYVGLLSTSAKPIEDLAEDMMVSKGSASSYVHEARRRGLLTRTPQGTAGGVLTEKAIELLRRSPDVGEETG